MLIWRKRGVRIHAPPHAERGFRLQQSRLRPGRIELPQWRDVVEDPKPAAMRCHAEVIVFDDEVANGGRWHVQTEGLPVLAIIERNVDGALRAGEKQTSTLRVFPHYVHRLTIGNPAYDLLPALTAVACAVNVG